MNDEAETIDGTEEVVGDAKAPSSWWLNAIDEAEKAFKTYQDKCDKIDKLYADLERLSNSVRDREFQLFWANVQVLGPSVYSRPPVPVVTPRFKDRRPLAQMTSELLERTAVVAFETEDIDGVMRLVRDDLVISARGAIWCRYESRAESDTLVERVCIEHADRKDFLHEPARKWKEVDWVAKRSWMSKREMRRRFLRYSGEAYKGAAFEVRKDDRDNGAATKRTKAGVWEIWCKSQNKVFWVTEGVDVLLDSDRPHLKLEGFFPCPKPAFGTTQRRSLIPVPDYVFYKDQLEEINELTRRISALADSVKVRGFYPAGAGEIGEAVEIALKTVDDRQVLIPVSNWAMFGGGAAKDAIVWLPLDQIINTIVQLINMRRQLIDDVYQITGLSDIMRGASDPNETLGAQQLKSQYGSVRVRDRQDELVRIARDTVRIMAEIIAENFQSKTLLTMSQMEIPTDADVRKQKQPIEQQIRQIERELKDAQTNPQTKALIQQNPQQAQQLLQQAQQGLQQGQAALAKIDTTVTIEKIMKLLRDERTRPFVLDIETDSTIQPDEDAEKQRRTEFLTALGSMMTQLSALVASDPGSAGFAGELLKFAIAPYRAGRELDGAVDEFVEQLQQKAGQPQPNPEQERIKGEMQIRQEEAKGRMQELQFKAQASQQDAQLRAQAATAEFQAKQAEHALRLDEIRAKMEADRQQHAQDMQKGMLEIEKLRLEIAKISGQVQGQQLKNENQAASAIPVAVPAA
ncbi:hypothetical protein [Neorhizobium sp. DT-125]|uniref:hypothetical protein n=1 Tax=Neorhizobium sp. DT-125 TaxID=3396163 RepID=UPI003F1A00D1